VVLVSSQAPHTLGAKLLDPRPTVRFHGRDWNLWAEVHKLDGFSGHAGHDDVLAYLQPLVGRVRKVRLVHGEVEAARALQHDLYRLGFSDVAVPAPGDRVEL
jgi:metallo-beta-lactamase family protein